MRDMVSTKHVHSKKLRGSTFSAESLSHREAETLILQIMAANGNARHPLGDCKTKQTSKTISQSHASRGTNVARTRA